MKISGFSKAWLMSLSRFLLLLLPYVNYWQLLYYAIAQFSGYEYPRNNAVVLRLLMPAPAPQCRVAMILGLQTGIISPPFSLRLTATLKYGNWIIVEDSVRLEKCFCACACTKFKIIYYKLPNLTKKNLTFLSFLTEHPFSFSLTSVTSFQSLFLTQT